MPVHWINHLIILIYFTYKVEIIYEIKHSLLVPIHDSSLYLLFVYILPNVFVHFYCIYLIIIIYRIFCIV